MAYNCTRKLLSVCENEIYDYVFQYRNRCYLPIVKLAHRLQLDVIAEDAWFSFSGNVVVYRLVAGEKVLVVVAVFAHVVKALGASF